VRYCDELETVAKPRCLRLNDRTRGAWPQSCRARWGTTRCMLGDIAWLRGARVVIKKFGWERGGPTVRRKRHHSTTQVRTSDEDQVHRVSIEMNIEETLWSCKCFQLRHARCDKEKVSLILHHSIPNHYESGDRKVACNYTVTTRKVFW
jgi:hypothetical protein